LGLFDQFKKGQYFWWGRTFKDDPPFFGRKPISEISFNVKIGKPAVKDFSTGTVSAFGLTVGKNNLMSQSGTPDFKTVIGYFNVFSHRTILL